MDSIFWYSFDMVIGGGGGGGAITRCHHLHNKGNKQKTKTPYSPAAGLGFEARRRG